MKKIPAPVVETNVSALGCTVDLPERFRQDDILAFHRRDEAMLAERVEADVLYKGMIWSGYPACLTIRFHERYAEAHLAMDGAANDLDVGMLEKRVRHMLGLTQSIEDFETRYLEHPQLGKLIKRNRGLRVPLTASVFEALTWAVIGQQISVQAAVSVRRKYIQAVGAQHSGGMWCYPDAGLTAHLNEENLRQAGFSHNKARTLIELSRLVEEGLLPLEAWCSADALPVDDIRESLLRIRGIGPWTVSYGLLRGYGWLDGSLHGDVAVRRNLQRLLGDSVTVTEAYAQQWLAGFAPWRALVAAHLWAMQSVSGY